jgi:hypothetical protein
MDSTVAGKNSMRSAKQQVEDGQRKTLNDSSEKTNIPVSSEQTQPVIFDVTFTGWWVR